MDENLLAGTEIQKNEFWNMMRLIIGTLAISESQLIIKELLKQSEIRSKDLISKTGIPDYRFHTVMKKLVMYQIITRTVTQDKERAVYYSISPYGTSILKLSKPLLSKIKLKVEEQHAIQKKSFS